MACLLEEGGPVMAVPSLFTFGCPLATSRRAWWIVARYSYCHWYVHGSYRHAGHSTGTALYNGIASFIDFHTYWRYLPTFRLA